MGDGTSSAAPVTLSFHTAVEIGSPTLFITPGLDRFLAVMDAPSGPLPADSGHELRLALSLPTDAEEGEYRGVLQVRDGQRTIPAVLKLSVTVDFDGAVVAPNVRVLSRESAALLVDRSEDGRTLVFSGANDELASLAPGLFLVGGPSPSLPDGFLGEVVDIQLFGGQLAVVTGPASLADLFVKASISLEQAISSELIDGEPFLAPGVSLGPPPALSQKGMKAAAVEFLTLRLAKVNVGPDPIGPLTATGDFSLSGTLKFEADISLSGLEKFELSESVTASSAFRMEASEEISGGDSKEIFVARLRPFWTLVGYVPVVLVPKAFVEVGASGEITAGFEAGASIAATATAGIRYEAGEGWDSFTSSKVTSDYTEPTLTSTLEARAFIGPKVQLLLYGVAGPEASIEGALLVNADINRTPFWRLEGEVVAKVGARIELFDQTIAEGSLDVLLYKEILAEGPDPCTEGSFVPLAGDRDGFAPPTETACPSASLKILTAAVGSVTNLRFDQTPGTNGAPSESYTGHTFTGLPEVITSAKLTFRVRAGEDANGRGADGDQIWLLFTVGQSDLLSSIAWGRFFGSYSPQGDPGLIQQSEWKKGDEAEVTVDLAALPLKDGGAINVLGMLQANGYLDVLVADETGADFFLLEVNE